MEYQMTYNKIKDNFTYLKSKESLSIIDEVIDFTTKNNSSFMEGFAYYSEKMCEMKRNNVILHSIKMAGFPKIKNLQEVDFSYQPSLNKALIDELNTLRFVERGENVIFYGNSGVGKTHLATAIGVTAARNRYSTYFIKCAQLMNDLLKPV